mmetsp:Transcript_15940/g.41229  ORF Transcript_15940/g.41229 Transcript_15940/m.41229 type:complete len:149 (+) Transcript_15940:1326-1772(+)
MQSSGLVSQSPVPIKAIMAFALRYFPPGQPSCADKVQVSMFYVSPSGNEIVGPSTSGVSAVNDASQGISKVFAELKGWNHCLLPRPIHSHILRWLAQLPHAGEIEGHVQLRLDLRRLRLCVVPPVRQPDGLSARVAHASLQESIQEQE